MLSLSQSESVQPKISKALLVRCAVMLWIAISSTSWSAQSVTLAWDSNTETNISGYKVYYGVASGVYTNSVNASAATNATVPGLIEGVTYYFAATAYTSSGLESDYSDEVSYSVPVIVPNRAPTLNGLSNLTIAEDAGAQTVSLSGITPGATNEIQTLTIVAVSSNPALIPNPAVNYTSPNSTGSLTFTPASGANGTATVSVTVNDGQATSNLLTRTFVVTVNAVNDPPTLNALSNLALSEDAGLQTVSLAGIGTGAANETQTLTVSATSSNPSLIPNPAVNYTSPNATGSLTFTPVANASGSATITVTVDDAQATNNTVARTFTVTVNAVNDPPTLNALSNLAINENAGAQTVNLAGIGSGAANEAQTLVVSAVSSNPGLIPNPVVNYTSPNAAGSLLFTPAIGVGGTATITVTVNDGQAASNTFTRAFAVSVNRLPTIAGLTNRIVGDDSTTPPIAFTIGDAETPVANLTLSGTSSDQSLVPNANIVFGGSDANRTLSLTTMPANLGSVTITISVSDGSGTSSTSFQLNVLARPAPPGNFRLTAN